MKILKISNNRKKIYVLVVFPAFKTGASIYAIRTSPASLNLHLIWVSIVLKPADEKCKALGFGQNFGSVYIQRWVKKFTEVNRKGKIF